MNKVIITTSIRETSAGAVSGRLFVVDINQQRILQTTTGIEPPHREHDINPRGGMRGLRGLGIYNGELAVAIFSAVLFFDRSWNFLRVATHPAVAGIHEIFYSKDGVWVTSTANDMLVRFDHAGKLQEFHSLHEQQSTMKRLGGEYKKNMGQDAVINRQLDFRKRSYFASDPYDRLHLNSVCLMPDGQILISLGLIVGEIFNFQMRIKTLMMKVNVWNTFLGINARLRRLMGLKKNMLSELIIQPATGSSAVASRDTSGQWHILLHTPVDRNPSHAIRFLDDGSFIYLLTSFGEIAHFNPHSGMISRTKVTDKFLRGLLVLPDGKLLVGASNSLLFFDLQEKKVFAQIKLSDNELETIFDIQILPDDFDLPPHSLQDITGRINAYDGTEVIWDQAGHADSGSHS